MPRLLFFFLFSLPRFVAAQTAPDDPGPYLPVRFAIVKSTATYETALRQAKEAAGKLHFKLDLRGAVPHPADGLTFSSADCDSSGWDYPCYQPRGRWDNGNYVSIEWSDNYAGMTKGRYIIVIASGGQAEKSFDAALARAKKVYPDAYAKTVPVYHGCMH